MKNIFRKMSIVATVAVVLAFGSVIASPALAGSNTFWDDSTAGWLNGNARSDTVAMASVPCDPAAAKKGLYFLP